MKPPIGVTAPATAPSPADGAPVPLMMRLGRAIQSRWEPSIAHCLLISLLFGSMAVWAVVYAFGLALMLWPEHGGFDRELGALGRGVQKTLERAPDDHAMREAVAVVIEVKREFERNPEDPTDVSGFNIWRKDGTWVAGSPNVPRVRLGDDHPLGFFSTEKDGETYRVFTRCARDCDYRVEAMHARSGRWREFNRIMLSPASLLFPLLAGFPLFFMLTLVTVRGALKPLQDLSSELSDRAPGDLRPVTTAWEFSTELKPIIRAINTTFHKLEEVRQREREFLADAAHEIRTPLAVINAHVDTLLNTDDPTEKAATAERLQAGMARASRLVNQLLSLARLEAEADHQVVMTDLPSVARDCLAAMAQDARGKAMEVAYEGPDRLVLPSPGYAIESIVGNLVGNAVRYGRPGGQVEIHVETLPSGHVSLSVWDDGPGIPAADLPAMLERFRRGESRHEVSGAGLGLPIVASAARQLGAQLDFRPGLAGRGICIRLEWQPSMAPAPGATAP